ncbi:MAG: potassium channel family protein [Actinomycetota bacterium]
MAAPWKGEIDPKKRRRVLAIVLLRALLTAAVLVALYYLLPIDEEWRLSAGVRAVVGSILFLAVLSWQVRTVARSRHPGIRAIGALALTVPLFLLLFASTYFVMSTNSSGAFSQEDLTRTDALYLAVTIFSTVGFGDISATSQSARLVVTSQMILDLLLLGIGINAFVHAARLGRERQSDIDEVGS